MIRSLVRHWKAVSRHRSGQRHTPRYWRRKMPGLRNSNINMEIGYCTAGKQKKLYVQVGHERQYYGTLMSGKADKFLKMLQKWDEAGGNDSGEE